MIKYSLDECHLKGTKKYWARVNHYKTFNENDLIKHILNLNTTLNEGEVYSTLVDTLKAIKEILFNGNKINLFNKFIFSTSISGCFDSPDQGFDSNKHKINIIVNPTQSLQNEFNIIRETQKTDGKVRVPFISSVLDIATNTNNQTITKNKNIRIKGNNLSFDMTQSDEGIFITDSKGVDLVKLEIDEKPSDRNIKILIPDNIPVPPDNRVFIEIRTRLGSQTLRKGRNRAPLMIA